WYGILGIDDEKSDPGGTPRPVYYALQKANRALWTEPVSWKRYEGTIPIEVYAMDDVTAITAQTASGPEASLEKKGHWWTGSLPLEGLAGVEEVTLRIQTKDLGELRQTRPIVTDWGTVGEELRPVSFAMEKAPETAGARDWIELTL